MDYQFLIDTYETERIKTLSTWSTFTDEDLSARPHSTDKRGRNALEHMVHQCMGEIKWFTAMLGVDVGAPPLPEKETLIKEETVGGTTKTSLPGPGEKPCTERPD